MDDAEFRRRAHALLDDLATEGNVRRSDAWAGGDEAKALIAAGPSSGLPVAGCPCETCKAKPATDPDAPVRIEAVLTDPAATLKECDWADPFQPYVGLGVTYLRPSLIVLAREGQWYGPCSIPRWWVRLDLRDGGALFVKRDKIAKGSGGTFVVAEWSPCRAIPEPWRNV